MDWVESLRGVPIRLTDERWVHIVENHDDLAGHYDHVLDAVQNPDLILRGYGGTLVAVKGVARGRHLAVVYKEVSRDDGFVITAYLTSRVNKRVAIWPRARRRKR